MRQAIETRYFGPTEQRGARVLAQCQAGKIVVSWDDDLDVNDNHRSAAIALVAKLGWPVDDGRWVGGGNSHGTGNVYVWTAE